MYIEKINRVLSFINGKEEMNLTIECVINGEICEVNFPKIDLKKMDIVTGNSMFIDQIEPMTGQLVLNLKAGRKGEFATIKIKENKKWLS